MQGSDLKKLVVKTIIITLVSVLGAFAITVGALCLFSPATCASFFDGVGNYSASVFFYEKHYDKTGDINVLDTLYIKSYEAEDYVRAEKYLFTLISHEGFDSLCADNASPDSLTDKEYYYSSYALVLAKNGKESQAIFTCETFVSENGYTKYNPFRALVDEYKADATLSATLKNKIETILSGLNGAQLTYANEDLNKLN